MKIFPLDPTPYVIIFSVTVFLSPWLVFAFYTSKHIIYILRKYPDIYFILCLKQHKELKRLRESDSQLKYIYQKAIKWLKVTIVCWSLGFAALATTLFLLDKNNLLVNFSKGIYR